MRRFLDKLIGRRPAKFQPWRCPSCGQAHDDLPAAAVSAPRVWSDASERERSEVFELTTDTCIWKGEHFFIRGCLELPFTDRAGAFQFGVWTSLSRDNFNTYLETYDDPEPRRDMPPMFGWFSNSLPGYPETLNLKCSIRPRIGGLRPLIELEASDHPLSVQQRQGLHFGDAVAYTHQHLGL